MKFFLIFPIYLGWHYTTAFRDMKRLAKNFSWFFFHFFSVELLLKTLFSPFRRLSGQEAGGKKENIFSRILVNLLMRLVGFFLRSTMIVLGLIFVILVNVLFVLVLIGWFFLPVIIPFLFLLGLSFLI